MDRQPPAPCSNAAQHHRPTTVAATNGLMLSCSSAISTCDQEGDQPETYARERTKARPPVPPCTASEAVANRAATPSSSSQALSEIDEINDGLNKILRESKCSQRSDNQNTASASSKSGKQRASTFSAQSTASTTKRSGGGERNKPGHKTNGLESRKLNSQTKSQRQRAATAQDAMATAGTYDSMSSRSGGDRSSPSGSESDSLSSGGEGSSSVSSFAGGRRNETNGAGYYIRQLQYEDLPAVKALQDKTLEVKYDENFYSSLARNLNSSRQIALVCCLCPQIGRRGNVHASASGESSGTQERGGNEKNNDVVVGAITCRINRLNKYLLGVCKYAVVREAYIMTLAVDPEHRRCGIASTLLELCVEGVRQNPRCEAITLHTLRANIAAKNLYEQFGFTCSEVLPAHYWFNEQNHDGVKYEMRLRKSSSLPRKIFLERRWLKTLNHGIKRSVQTGYRWISGNVVQRSCKRVVVQVATNIQGAWRVYFSPNKSDEEQDDDVDDLSPPEDNDTSSGNLVQRRMLNCTQSTDVLSQEHMHGPSAV